MSTSLEAPQKPRTHACEYTRRMRNQLNLIAAVEKCKVRLVVEGQHMHRKDEQGRGDFEDAFSPVPHASGFRMILALATQNNMHCDHVDISQAFVQGDLLPGDGYNGKVYISAPPGYDEDPNYVYQLRRPLYGMPSAARAWHHTMSAYLKSQGCKLVGFERSMWTVVKEGHVILITAHIDDFIIACADRTVLERVSFLRVYRRRRISPLGEIGRFS